MKYQEMVEKVHQITGESAAICSEIMDSYEKYCAQELKRPFAKKITPEMIAWIGANTGCEARTVEKVITALINTLRAGVKDKLLFRA
ncbi:MULTISPECIES: hypothetical protein [Enterococcus]|uniref:Uncharacterized protein n=1 Tax=Enterococcus alishanensis TaxID=1303817 RepID=A0ABS6TGF7_9ENTE|nr:hypothetical protein [Enterococcus alishanensis]MBV7392044.1 hypothetical protein [Enterococcus alishanensis]